VLKVLGRCGVIRFVLRFMVLSRCNECRIGTWKDGDDGRRTGAGTDVRLGGGGILGGSVGGSE
jgi:hypothetical protein